MPGVSELNIRLVQSASLNGFVQSLEDLSNYTPSEMIRLRLGKGLVSVHSDYEASQREGMEGHEIHLYFDEQINSPDAETRKRKRYSEFVSAEDLHAWYFGNPEEKAHELILSVMERLEQKRIAVFLPDNEFPLSFVMLPKYTNDEEVSSAAAMWGVKLDAE
jgi:hypothetical protein